MYSRKQNQFKNKDAVWVNLCSVLFIRATEKDENRPFSGSAITLDRDKLSRLLIVLSKFLDENLSKNIVLAYILIYLKKERAYDRFSRFPGCR